MRFTTADLELLPKREDVRYEIIDGELLVSTAPHLYHQAVSTAIASAVHIWDQQSGLGVVATAPGLIFTVSDNVVPDVVWISHARLAHAMDEAGHLLVAPELVVEVLSPGAENARRDLDLKLKLYSVEGVREYWVLDWRLRTVRVYRRDGAELRLAATLGDGDTLNSPLLPGFECSVNSLWPPRREPAQD
jgi:Uma2 family endonuclease